MSTVDDAEEIHKKETVETQAAIHQEEAVTTGETRLSAMELPKELRKLTSYNAPGTLDLM